MKCRTLNCVHSNVDDSVQVIKTICKSVDKKQQWHEFTTGAKNWDLRQSWILDFHAVDSGFQVLDSSFCQWNLDSGFQSFVGFRIPRAVFRGAIHSTKIPTGPTGNGPVFSKLFRLDRNDPLSFGPKFSGNFGLNGWRPRIPHTKCSGIPDSTSNNFTDSGIHWFP